MREILFRGKKVDNGEWFEGNFIFQFDHKKKEACGFITKQEQDFDKPDFKPVEIDIKTLGQFTGLCDKNGMKIFEGDIVRYRNIENFKVVWWKGRYGCELISETDEEIFDDAFTLDWNVSTVLEVIGNIFDNPELLK